MMHMTFYWGKNVTLLVESWRVRFKLISSAKAGNPTSQIDAPLLQGGAGKAFGSKLFALRLAGAALFRFNSGIGYLLMLAVMLFNGGVFVAIVLGLAVGTQKLLSLNRTALSLNFVFLFSLSQSHVWLLSLTEN
ncbi:copper transporter 5.1 [Fagus crenata]